MAEPVVQIDGDEIAIGSFTLVDGDIAEHLQKESPDHQASIVRDAVLIGMKVILNERVSLATDTILAKVETRINEILANPVLQDAGTPFRNVLDAIAALKNEIDKQKNKQTYASKAKGDAYEDYIMELLETEYGHAANIVKTATKRAIAGRPGQKGDIALTLNPGTTHELKIVVEAKHREPDGLSIERVKHETAATIQQRKAPVVVWALSTELGHKLMQEGAIDWSIDFGYVMVIADQDAPERARPLLGAAIRVAQLVHQWQIRVDRQIDGQFTLDFFARIKTRLQKIKEISGELTTIGEAQERAARVSTALYKELNEDVKDFSDKLTLSGVGGIPKR